MNRNVFFLLLLFIIPAAGFSQTLNKVADILFKNVKTKLTITEKNQLATSWDLSCQMIKFNLLPWMPIAKITHLLLLFFLWI